MKLCLMAAFTSACVSIIVCSESTADDIWCVTICCVTVTVCVQERFLAELEQLTGGAEDDGEEDISMMVCYIYIHTLYIITL
jgi:hypothetical protein